MTMTHDPEAAERWAEHIESGAWLATLTRDDRAELATLIRAQAAKIEYLRKDSATAWGTCEKRRLEAVEARNEALLAAGCRMPRKREEG